VKVILFGATGMVGAGVLQECLIDPRVTSILVVGRQTCGVTHPKLQEILHADFFNYTAIQPHFAASHACFFCLGVSSVGMAEETYRHVTYDLTLAAAHSMLAVNDQLTFCYVSGAGTDTTERGSMMWARVKGATENALSRMPFKAAYMFRAGFIQPLKGVRSKVRWYQAIYTAVGPLYPILSRVAPRYVTTTEAMGRSMIRAVVSGYSKPILETEDINRLAVAA
jgi:uncharacterized protein YbjT (DUF2867 family)